MKVAHVVSNGPSARTAVLPDDGAVRIGVNMVSIVQPDLDWVCFGDSVVWEYLYLCKEPRFGYILQERDCRYCTDPPPQGGRQFFPWEWLWMPEDLGYSANIAIWAARTMGALEIHLWGFDFAGDTYADGRPCMGYRGADHWEREVRYFDRTCELVRQRGATLFRH